MQTIKLQSGTTIRCYADVDEFPVERRSYLTRYQIESSEIDTSPEALAARIGGMMVMNNEGRKDHLNTALQNMYIAMQAAANSYAPDSLSLGVLIHDVDGKLIDDLSPEGLQPIMARLSITVEEMNQILAELKKNSRTAARYTTLGIRGIPISPIPIT